MNIELIVCILFGILLAISTWMAGEYWKEKEHYRCRVFELTKGKEGSNLVKVIPDTPPPPKPPTVHYYRYDWRLLNPTAMPQERLNEAVKQMQADGYHFMPGANLCGLLAFRRTEEVATEEESEFMQKLYD